MRDTVYSPVPVDTGVADTVWMTRIEVLQEQLERIDTIFDTITINTIDSVFVFVEDYLTPKTYINTYSDSLYSLTVKDSVVRNALMRQWVDVQVSSRTVYQRPAKRSLVLAGISPTVSGLYGNVMYVDRQGWGIGVGYDPINESVITHLYLTAMSFPK